MSERIQKMLATAGVASRREIERLIGEGRVLVNGKPAELGQQIDHEDQVRVDGKTVALQSKAAPLRVLIYKKRVGELVTREDPEGRRTVFRKLPALSTGRWIAVGRLDINTSGLLLFTNHGELARRLTHPSFEVPRLYAARVLGTVDEEVIARWKKGVELDDGMARFERVEPSESEDGEGANQWYHVSVREGRNRLVRRLIESQDLQVSRLIRLRYGPVELGRGMKSSSAREATPQEVSALLAAVKLSEEEVGLGIHHSRGGKPPGRGEQGGPAKRRDADERAVGAERRRGVRAQQRREAPAREERRPELRGAARGESRSPAGGEFRGPARGESRRPARGESRDSGRGESRGSARGEFRGPARSESRVPARGESRDSGRSESRGPARGESRNPAGGEFRGPARSESRRPARGESRGSARGESRDSGRGESRGPARSESRGPARGESRGPARGESRGPARSESRGPGRSESRGPTRSESRGPARGESRGPARSESRSPARGESRGPARGESRGPSRAAPAGRGESTRSRSPGGAGPRRPRSR